MLIVVWAYTVVLVCSWVAESLEFCTMVSSYPRCTVYARFLKVLSYSSAVIYFFILLRCKTVPRGAVWSYTRLPTTPSCFCTVVVTMWRSPLYDLSVVWKSASRPLDVIQYRLKLNATKLSWSRRGYPFLQFGVDTVVPSNDVRVPEAVSMFNMFSAGSS